MDHGKDWSLPQLTLAIAALLTISIIVVNGGFTGFFQTAEEATQKQEASDTVMEQQRQNRGGETTEIIYTVDQRTDTGNIQYKNTSLPPQDLLNEETCIDTVEGTWCLSIIDALPDAGSELDAFLQHDDDIYIAYYRYPREDNHDKECAIRSSYSHDGQLKFAKSLDGGRTWETYVVDSTAPNDACLNSRSVSIDGVNDTIYISYFTTKPADTPGNKFNSSFHVATSADGGRTWSTQTLATMILGERGSHNSISVVDKDTAYISHYSVRWQRNPYRIWWNETGLTVVKTTDGGKTWSHTNINNKSGMYTSIEAFPDGTVHIGYYNAKAGEQHRRAAVSTNGGRTWNDQVIANRDIGSTGILGDLDAASSRQAFISLDWPWRGILLAETQDRGKQWSLQQVSPTVRRTAYRDPTHVDVAGSPDNLLVSYFVMPYGVSTALQIAQSSNGGDTWETVTMPREFGGGYYHDLLAPSLDTIYIPFKRKRQLRFARFEPTQ